MDTIQVELVSSINCVRESERGNYWGNWACVLANGKPMWRFYTVGANRLPVRASKWRGDTPGNFVARWYGIDYPNVVADPRGGSRPPRSAASAIREQERKRRWSAARSASRRAERAAAEQAVQPLLFA
jgi:hypothetical protein